MHGIVIPTVFSWPAFEETQKIWVRASALPEKFCPISAHAFDCICGGDDKLSFGVALVGASLEPHGINNF